MDTVATIFLVKVGSALRGRILDLSLSGCRIRTDERFQVGIYTRVETEFHLEACPSGSAASFRPFITATWSASAFSI